MDFQSNHHQQEHCLINTSTSEVIRGSIFELAQQLGCRVETIQALVLNAKSNNKYWGQNGFSGYELVHI
ncbi:hypothetical protein [Vibrio barjaei]|uniref:hypothetical protein n=1 Tax=Vibrio barjaei TaxID=1676683 RepID=UPI0007BBF6AA|nr:hypothetical protein [Vibrio barjaei]OIN26777.1 hypothetical protein AWH66_2000030 [Vibrio barjaei]